MFTGIKAYLRGLKLADRRATPVTYKSSAAAVNASRKAKTPVTPLVVSKLLLGTAHIKNQQP